MFAGFPPLARAVTIGPIDLNPLNPTGGSLGGLTGGIANVAVDAFHAIIKSLFAPVAKFITAELIGWLIAVPNLTQGNVAQLEQTVEAMGGGLLGAVATISTIRYWAAGFAGGGDSGFAALEGLTRTVGAALFLALWPWLFDTAVSMTNLLTGSLLGSGAVVHSVSHLLAAGLGAGIGLNLTPVGLFVDIAIAAAASLLFLGLLLVKIVVSISTILVFIGMPLAAVVWPVVPWIARMAVRAFAVCLLVPVLWALCFAGAAAVSLNALSFNGGTVLNTLLQPLVAIVLLWVTLKLPVHLARVAMLGAAPLGGGFASRAVSYAAGSQMRDTLRSHAPGWAGGQTSKHWRRTRAVRGPDGRKTPPGRDARRRRGHGRDARRDSRHRSCERNGDRRIVRGLQYRLRQRPGLHAPADRPGQRRRPSPAERATDSELRRPRAGFRQREVRGAVPRADQPGLRRAGQSRAGSAARRDPARHRAARLRSWGRRAGASGLPGNGRMVTAGARGVAHARRRQPRCPRRGRGRHAGDP